MSNATRILIVEDNPHDYTLAQREIRRALDSCVFERVETRQEYLDALESFQPDVILCDYSLPSFDGMTALTLARQQASFTPLIIWTGAMSEDEAVKCIKAGAANYVIKDNLKRLGTAILHAIEERKLVLENKLAQELILSLSRFPHEAPGPVLRVTHDGIILYANAASKVLLQEWHSAATDELPPLWKQEVATAFDQNEKRSMDVVVGERFYSILVAPVQEEGYINLYATDVTKLKQAERKFQDIFEGSPVGIFQSLPDGRFIRVNSAMARMYGYDSPEEMISSISDIGMQLYRAPHDRQTFKQLLEKLDTIQEFEMENIRRDGSVIWTSTSARAVRDSNGVISYYEGFTQDVTDRRKARAQIDDLLALNEKILNHSPLGIITYKLTGECVFANERVASMVGTTVENLKAQNFHGLDSWKNSGLYALAQAAMSTNTLTSGDVHHISTFGKDVWLAVSCVTFQAKGEQHLLFSMSDITERKQAEHALLQSQARYQDLFDKSPVSLWEEDYSLVKQRIDALCAEGITDFSEYFNQYPDAVLELASLVKIIDVNKTTLDLFHAPQKEDLLKDLAALVREDVPQHFQEEIMGLMGPTKSFLWEGPDQTFDGQTLELIVMGTLPLGHETDWSRVIVSIIDNTQRKQVEQRLRESEHRYRALFEEMPTPILEEDLSQIKTYLDHLKEQGVTDFPEYFESHPEAIQECAARVRILDVNKAAVQMYHADSKDHLMSTFTRGIGEHERQNLKRGLTAITEGKTRASWESQDTTIPGEPIIINVNSSVLPGHEQDYSKVIITTTDITERKQAEEALRDSEEKYRLLFESNPLPMWIYDLETLRFLKVNGAAIDHYGYTESEFMAMTIKDIRPPADVARLLGNISHVNNGMDRAGVWNHFKKDGSLIEVEIISHTVEFDGRPAELVLANDITERKRTENELRSSEERFRQLVDNIEEVFWMTDARTDQEIYASPAMEKIWGIPLDRYLHEKDFYLNSLVPEDRAILLDAIQREKRGEKVEMEYRIVRPDGSIRWIWDRAFPIFDETGQVIRLAGIAADITERKDFERQLRTLLLAVEQSGSTIVITDIRGNIEYVNPQFTKSTGYSFEEVIGQNPRILKTGHTSSEEYKDLWETIKSGEQWRGELYNRKKNGDLFWEQATISPIYNEQRQITHFMAVKEDITQRKQNELEIQRHLMELEALYENGLSIGRLLEPKEIGNQIIQTFARYLSWHHVVIRLLNPETDVLELIAFNQPDLSDDSRRDAETRFSTMISKAGQGLSGWAMQTGRSIRTGDVRVHPQYVYTHQNILSGLYMPLKVGDRVIGCISVESDKPDAFTAQDERLLATLANQAAIAFENARLYQSSQLELAERERAQQALWTSETHYRQLADSITDILFELDQDLRYTHWNKASEMFSGIPAEDAIGKSMQEISGFADDVFKQEDIYNAVLKERQARTLEIEVPVKGSKRDLEIRAYPSARGVSVVARDVTERKVFETLLQKRFTLIEYAADHTLAEVMQKVIDEISELTESHIGFLHLVEGDQQTINLQTWSTETLEEHCQFDGNGMHYPLDQAGVWADAVRQRRSVIHTSYETLPNKTGLPEGHAPVYREMVTPIIRNEKIVAVIGVGNKAQEYTQQDVTVVERLADYAWDITERRRIESELAQERNQLARRVEERTADLSRANSNLARALRVKDEFLANMSHELRTPLNAILGLSESLSEQVAGPLNEKQSRYLSTINESGHHLLALINDILDLAKIEAGQITLDINKVDINSVCQASLRMIKQLAQKKNQEVIFEIDPDFGLMWADERRLKQMIVNLLSNAVKFTPESGRLGLEIHGDRDGNKVSISVWDHGIGIRESDMPRLFQSFVQLDSGLAREATGTGLGLALVAQMAQMHGGSVAVESQVGQGSRFTIMLPWQPALAGDSSSRLRTTGTFRAIQPNEVRPTILLIEDTQEVVMMLVDYLEISGFHMITAQDGIDGLTQAKLAHPDLILMDIQMPRMDGFETTMRLRSDLEFKDTPIIALTALAMPNDRQRCLDAGMNEYLSKPINLKTLSNTIKALLYNREAKPS